MAGGVATAAAAAVVVATRRAGAGVGLWWRRRTGDDRLAAMGMCNGRDSLSVVAIAYPDGQPLFKRLRVWIGRQVHGSR